MLQIVKYSPSKDRDLLQFWTIALMWQRGCFAINNESELMFQTQCKPQPKGSNEQPQLQTLACYRLGLSQTNFAGCLQHVSKPRPPPTPPDNHRHEARGRLMRKLVCRFTIPICLDVSLICGTSKTRSHLTCKGSMHMPFLSFVVYILGMFGTY